MSDLYVPQTQASRSPPPGPASSSSDSSSTATIASNSNVVNAQPAQTLSPIVDHLETAIDPVATAQSTPSNDAIEAAIRAAINSGESRSSPSIASSGKGGGGDGRTVPPRDTRTQLFVGNLPYRVRWQDLKDLFRRAGTVLRADVSLGADNRSRGYGTVLLATAEDAGRAIDMFNGYEWQARMLEVRVDKIGGPMMGESTTMPGAGMQAPILGGGVQIVHPAGMYQTPQSFVSSSSQFPSQNQVQSPAYSLQIPTGSHQHQIFSPQPQHVSISQMQSQLHLPGQSHFEQLQSQPYHGQQPQQAQQNPPSIPGRTLFVGNLPYHVQWQDLKDLFRRTPGGVTVLRADVALGPDGRSKGFGTVTLRTEEEAERAKRWYSGYEFNGRQLKVHHDRVPISAPPSHVHSPQILHSSAGSPVYSLPSSLLSQQMASLNFPDAFTAERHLHPSRRSSSPANTASSSSSKGHPPHISSRLRNEAQPSLTLPTLPTSSTIRSQSSPLLRQAQVSLREQPQPLLQSPLLQSSTSRPGTRSARSHSGSVSEAPDFTPAAQTSSTATSPSSSAVSPVLSTSPSVSRPNRPTFIPLPAPSFNLDFDPSMASLESFNPPNNSDYDGDMESTSGEWSMKETESYGSSGQPARMGLQQTTPLQMHFKQYLQKERSDRESRQAEPRDQYSSPPPQNEQQLYQLLHGSRQVTTAAGVGQTGRSPQPPHQPYFPQPALPSLSQSVSSATSSAGSSASGAAHLLEKRERGSSGGSQRPVGLSTRAGSAASSSKSLPLHLGARIRSDSSSKIAPDGSPEKLDFAGRSQSVVSATGSTTSASESGLSASLSGSSRTGSSVPAGSLPLGARSPSKRKQNEILERLEKEKERVHPHHPGSITLPPPHVFSSESAVHAARATQEPGQRPDDVGSDLFQQYYPFAKLGMDDVAFEQSGAPTVQPKKHTTGSSDAGSVSSRRGSKESTKHRDVQQWSETQAYHHWQQQQAYQQQFLHQAPVTPSHHPYTGPQAQLTPHGLPPMTPSMPPFTFIGSQMTPGFQSPPGMYSSTHPISPNGPSHFQQRRARLVNDTRVRHHPNAPGTLSLPPQQLAFVPHQQSPPILSPASTIGPGTASLPPHSYLLPLGSPGSPYALGPHHPLHHTHGHQSPFQPPGVYGHVPHPLSHSFGHAVGPHGALSPGAPWGRPGDVQPYGNAAVGGPARRASGEKRLSRSRSRSMGRDQGDQPQPTYVPSGGQWYGHPAPEPKGYFDQLYMNPSPYRYDGPEGEKTVEREEGDKFDVQSAVEREILKDKSSSASEEEIERPPPVDSSSSQSSGAPHRTSSMSSTDLSSPDTPATSFLEEEEMKGFVSEEVQPTPKTAVGRALAPRLQHSRTDPGRSAEETSQVPRRATCGEPHRVGF